MDDEDDILKKLVVMSQIVLHEVASDLEEEMDEEIDPEQHIEALGKVLASVLFELCREDDETFISASGTARRSLPAALAVFNRGFAIRMRELEDPRLAQPLAIANYH